MSVWWSIGLSVGSLAVTWLVGERRRCGWLLAVCLQVAWLAYALLSTQWGFTVAAVVFGCMNLRNYLKWRRDDYAALARVGEVNAGECR